MVGERRLAAKQSAMRAWHICQTTQQLIVSLIISQLLTQPLAATEPNLHPNLQSVYSSRLTVFHLVLQLHVYSGDFFLNHALNSTGTNQPLQSSRTQL